MATYRFGVAVLVGLLLAGSHGAGGQQGSSGALTYDQMMAQAQQAKAQQAAAAAKHSKKKAAATLAFAATATAVAPTPTPAVTATATPASSAPAIASAPPAARTAAPTPAPAAEAVAMPEATVTAPVANETASASATPAAVPNVPTKAASAASFKPVNVGHGLGKLKVKKEKPPKLVPVDIVHGELTVDGLIAKAGLNFQIVDIRYFYIWVPGLGTTVISNQAFAGSKLETDALDGNTLTVTVDNHKLQLACDRPMLATKGKKKVKPVSMYVAIDRNWQKPSNYPEFGYGDLTKPPYSWPGTLADLRQADKAPPLPDNLKQHPESVKMCGKDGDAASCRQVSVPLVLGKAS